MSDSLACDAPYFELGSKLMNKIFGPRWAGVRWLVFGMVAILGLTALIYANPPTLGRAFKSNVVTPTAVSDYKVTPDDLLW